MNRSWFVIMLASITAALLVFSEDSVAQSTPPCSGLPTRVEADGAVIAVASYKAYKAYESTTPAKSNMSAQRTVPSRTVTRSPSVRPSSGRSGLRNGTHPLTPSVPASIRAKSSAVVSPTGVDVKDRSTLLRIMTTPTGSPVPPSSETSPVNSTLFKGAGAQNLGVSAMIGGFVLLSFLWFLWHWG